MPSKRAMGKAYSARAPRQQYEYIYQELPPWNNAVDDISYKNKKNHSAYKSYFQKPIPTVHRLPKDYKVRALVEKHREFICGHRAPFDYDPRREKGWNDSAPHNCTSFNRRKYRLLDYYEYSPYEIQPYRRLVSVPPHRDPQGFVSSTTPRHQYLKKLSRTAPSPLLIRSKPEQFLQHADGSRADDGDYTEDGEYNGTDPAVNVQEYNSRCVRRPAVKQDLW
eukprot:CAMPEP_0175094308 /NCGR_PEP_ID=MMETSP0086_2-20121207/3514_1 /TAXON_ID=136419 /ORGANISM="Unknown Unknown, Strain D1" /LENGTH=221 /DNA_ID=CAMNT_0016367403 /DNA_START=38 /DNA_END=700 /DNA_ORIENTATION=-